MLQLESPVYFFAYPGGTGIGLSGSDANDVCVAGFYKFTSYVDAAAGGFYGERWVTGIATSAGNESGNDSNRGKLDVIPGSF